MTLEISAVCLECLLQSLTVVQKKKVKYFAKFCHQAGFYVHLPTANWHYFKIMNMDLDFGYLFFIFEPLCRVVHDC
jgi:hypothetical protein